LDIPRLPAAPSDFDDFDAKKTELLEALRRVEQYVPEAAQQALAWSIVQFLKAIPDAPHPLWRAPAKSILPVSRTIVQMVMPFYKLPGVNCLFSAVRRRYEQGARVAQEKSRAKDWVWPEDYGGDDAPALYLLPEFQALFECEVPFGFADEARFRHQWVMASPGLGKTTLLSAQILADLARVMRGECSLFVLDSQDNELSHYLPRLKVFAPGGPLHDALVYLEANERHPLAINPFDFQGTNMRAVEQMVFFFMASFSDETSGHMRNVVRYAIHALSRMDSPTIFTFRELLTKGRYEALESEHPRLMELAHPKLQDIRQFLVKDMFEGAYGPTLGAVKARLQFILSDPLFREMFSSRTNKVNLRDLLQSAKVIVVNAKQGELHEGVEAFGRYFIGRLLQASEERGARKIRHLPVFATIDECHDYVAKDRNIADLFFQARKQSIGFCVAHHDLSQIKVPEVGAAFAKAAIIAKPVKTGVFAFDIQERGEVTMRVPPVKFSKPALQMTAEEWEIVEREQRAKWCRSPEDDVLPVGSQEALVDADVPDTYDEE
jgi:hypothetical protein